MKRGNKLLSAIVCLTLLLCSVFSLLGCGDKILKPSEGLEFAPIIEKDDIIIVYDAPGKPGEAADDPVEDTPVKDDGDETVEAYKVIGIGTCEDKDVVIPSVYKNKPVKGIGEFAFSDCSGINSITIPKESTSTIVAQRHKKTALCGKIP